MNPALMLDTLAATKGALILGGVVGSTAYGLAHEGSDVDRLGVYAAPTRAFHGLNPPNAKTSTIVRGGPDATLHEAGKFAHLCLQGNPTVMELLWLPGDLVEYATPYGVELLDLRRAFLSAPRVRGAYFGYANQQLDRLLGAGRFPNVPVDRIGKHARHLLRLLDQGAQLWETGELTVRVDDPDRYFDFAGRVIDDPHSAADAFLAAEKRFAVKTPLPDEPNRDAVEAWLLAVRNRYLHPST